MTAEPRSVVKLGGSLLDLPHVWRKLRNWLDALPGRQILVVGGGAMVDVIRQFDALHHLNQEFAHHLAIQAMSLNAQVAERLLQESTRIMQLPCSALGWQQLGRTVIFDPKHFAGDAGQRPMPLPHSWQVTSDSIAARVAREVKATHLYLLKSCPISHLRTWDELVAQGIVDQWFPNEAKGLESTEIVLLNFRALP